jgi:type II secretory pathway pseudopilin PulG
MHCAYCGSWVEHVSYVPCASCGRPTNGSLVRAPGGGAGMTPAVIVIVVVLAGLVIVSILGILSAIAIPNLLTAMQRSRQKRTIADLRTITTAAESYAVDNNVYPRAASIDDLKPLLAPKYLSAVPVYDGWGTKLRYQCTNADCSGYEISSAGSDKTFEHAAAAEYGEQQTSAFDCDIVLVNAKFVQYPSGVQP